MPIHHGPAARLLLAALAALVLQNPVLAGPGRDAVPTSSRTAGTPVANPAGDTVTIADGNKNNGRGPTIAGTVTVDATGPGSARVDGPVLSAAQSAGLRALLLYARALARAGGTLPALPGGQLTLARAGAGFRA